jgi:hypothetical protein
MESAVTLLSAPSPCEYLRIASGSSAMSWSPTSNPPTHAAPPTRLAAVRLGDVPPGVPVLSDVPIAAGAGGSVPPQCEPATSVEAK